MHAPACVCVRGIHYNGDSGGGGGCGDTAIVCNRLDKPRGGMKRDEQESLDKQNFYEHKLIHSTQYNSM